MACQHAALLLFSGSLLWLWASPRTALMVGSFRLRKRRWNVELLQDFFKSKAKHAPIWPVPLMNSGVTGLYSCLFTTCMHLFGWGSVKIWLNDIPTSSKGSNAIGISVDHCVQNLRWLLLIIHPRKLLHQKIRTLLQVDPRLIDGSCHNRQVFCRFE